MLDPHPPHPGVCGVRDNSLAVELTIVNDQQLPVSVPLRHDRIDSAPEAIGAVIGRSTTGSAESPTRRCGKPSPEKHSEHLRALSRVEAG
jgi:hypothetical protein